MIMKSINLISLLLFIMLICILLSGCKKYNCECVAKTSPNPPNSQAVGTTNFSVKGTKSKAKKQCEDHSTQEDLYGNKTVCEIK